MTEDAGRTDTGSDVPAQPPPVDQDLPWGATPPAPLGDTALSHVVGEVAAPLLAGFSIALIGVVAQNPEALRWPGAALLVLAVAAVLLIVTVQSGFRVRQYYWTRSDAAAWFPQNDIPPGLDAYYRTMHRDHMKKGFRARERMRISYDAGVSVLAFGVAIVVSPPLRYGDVPLDATEQWLRWVASLVLALGGIAEIVLSVRRPDGTE